MTDIFYSDQGAVIAWSEIDVVKTIYGPKGAGLAALPRAWTPPFILLPASLAATARDAIETLGQDFLERLRRLNVPSGKILVRSSVINETIWDRGEYDSIVVALEGPEALGQLREAIRAVIESAGNKPTALVFQSFIEGNQRGEFGNLHRVSKTRDHWELTTQTPNGLTTTARLNTQRDEAASEHEALSAKARLPPERLFGSIAAWLNNVLVRDSPARLNCEWVSHGPTFHIVQIDKEDEDVFGVNPFQLRIGPTRTSATAKGSILKPADAEAIAQWDKLKVLEELWSETTLHRPMLFYAALSAVPEAATEGDPLARDLESLLGSDNIVVRISGRTADEKILNLPRTDCLTPLQAADWCRKRKLDLQVGGEDVSRLAFIFHRYIPARASAWARANPTDPVVEIHGLWGLPDALQYCPYDIWEVHVPTDSATDYPDYKSNMLVAQEDGPWRYVRVKNEVARSLSISRRNALDIAKRTHEIAQRLQRACHVMWFVDCTDENGHAFNIPWYWVHAHNLEKNDDRIRHDFVTVTDRASLLALKNRPTDSSQYMIVLRPDQPALFRDNEFVKEIAKFAKDRDTPVLLDGSTLAHAYYQLVRAGCIVIAKGEKEFSRVRKLTPLGKIVRDKIPEKIAARQELGLTIEMPPKTRPGFLIGKILEEALEVRESRSHDERKIELADLLEIVRALAQMNGYTLEEIVSAADTKKQKLGGFDEGKILLQTGIGGPGQTSMHADSTLAQVLSRSLSGDTVEIPFTFFGFAELEQPRSIFFPRPGIAVEITLKSDRIAIRVVPEPEQLELPLSLEVKED